MLVKENPDLEGVVLGLLKGSSSGVTTSEVLRGVRNRGFEASYHELEAWLVSCPKVVAGDDATFTLARGYEESIPNRLRTIPEEHETAGQDTSDVLRRLISYYTECLHEEGKTLQSYGKLHGHSFVPLDRELLHGGRPTIGVRTDEFPGFIKNISGGTRPVFYGYPLILEEVEGDEGPDYRVIPVFLIRMDILDNPALVSFRLSSSRVKLNPVLLRKTRFSEREFLENRLDGNPEQYTTFKDRLDLVEAVLSDYDLRDGLLDPSAVVRARDVSQIPLGKPGLYNIPCLFAAQPNPYIKRLIGELSELAESSDGAFAESSLNCLAQSRELNAEYAKELSPPGKKVYGIGNGILNTEQRLAVDRAFKNRLSVITGPPGSGKSLVVEALVISSILNGKSVLFASRNQKAVNVVQERLEAAVNNNYTPFRVGGAFDQPAADIIQRLDQLPAREQSTSALQERYDALSADIAKLEEGLIVLEEAQDSASLNADRIDRLLSSMGKSDLPLDKLASTSAIKLLAAIKVVSGCDSVKRSGAFWGKCVLIFKGLVGKGKLAKLSEDIQASGLKDPPSWPKDSAGLETLQSILFELADLLEAYRNLTQAKATIAEAGETAISEQKLTDLRAQAAAMLPDLLKAISQDKAHGHGGTAAADSSLGSYQATVRRLRKSGIDEATRIARNKELKSIFPGVLQRLPAWSVTNLSAGGRIPLAEGVFDLVIIDEASQCDIPSCVPLLYRGKQAVIIGDPLQLSHISNISKQSEESLLRRFNLDNTACDALRYSECPVFHAGQAAAPQEARTFLSSHYRCHTDIISFANSAHWYDERLQVFTDESSLKRPSWWKRAIVWEEVGSDWEKGFYGGPYLLQAEIDRTVELVEEFLEKKGFDGTLGVVCPFRDMSDRIRDEVEKKVRSNLLTAADFEVQTVHGFQGDARDVIIYVMAVHENMPSRKRWFVSENRNLFNVAISRARACFVVVGSRDTVRELEHDGHAVKYLQDFVQYVESLEAAESNTTTSWEEGDPVFQPEQLWEERFYLSALKPAGIKVRAQYSVGPYKLDFALIQGDRKLDIEVDGEAYHKSASGHRLERDIERNIYMKARGWDVERFWVYELREDMQACLKKIKHWMK